MAAVKYTMLHAARQTDICEHLMRLHELVLALGAKRIIELGVRDGESTVALLEAAHKTEGHVWSVDITPCDIARARMKEYGLDARWTFTVADDLEFAKGWEPATVDLVFIDTSHVADHTRCEIAAYAPLVAPGGAMAFHDTETFRDGVLVPIQEFLAAHPGWYRFENYPNNNGLGIIHDLRGKRGTS